MFNVPDGASFAVWRINSVWTSAIYLLDEDRRCSNTILMEPYEVICSLYTDVASQVWHRNLQMVPQDNYVVATLWVLEFASCRMPIMVGLTLCSCDAVMYRVALAVRRGPGTAPLRCSGGTLECLHQERRGSYNRQHLWLYWTSEGQTVWSFVVHTLCSEVTLCCSAKADVVPAGVRWPGVGAGH